LSPDKVRELLSSVLEECDWLARLTDQLLTLARQDAGTAPPVREPVDVAGVGARGGGGLRPPPPGGGPGLPRGGRSGRPRGGGGGARAAGRGGGGAPRGGSGRGLGT